MAVSITCVCCGKIFRVPDKRKDTAQYCSRECRYPKVDIRHCLVCGTKFYASPSTPKKYCSHDCYWETMKGARPNHPNCHQPNQVEHSCEYCGKSFTLSPYKSQRSNRLFCSFECMGLANRHEPTKSYAKNDLERMYIQEQKSFQQIADDLGSTVWVIKRLLQENNIPLRVRSEWGKASWKHSSNERRMTASDNGKENIKKLLSIPPEQKRANSVKAAKALQDKKGPTSIEQIMMDSLDRLGIEYIFQFPFANKFLCDFKLANHNIIIECDGIYWHSSPEAKRRDKGKDAYLTKCGFKVLRFTGIQIRKDIGRCLAIIKEHMTVL